MFKNHQQAKKSIKKSQISLNVQTTELISVRMVSGQIMHLLFNNHEIRSGLKNTSHGKSSLRWYPPQGFNAQDFPKNLAEKEAL